MMSLHLRKLVLWITIPLTPVDSVHLTRFLAQLRLADSSACELVGRSLTNVSG